MLIHVYYSVISDHAANFGLCPSPGHAGANHWVCVEYAALEHDDE